MNDPRTFSLLARFVLAWLVVAVGVATVSPFVHPKEMQLVCSDAGQLKLVAVGDDSGTTEGAGHKTLDCAVCLAISLPTTAALLPLVPALSGMYAMPLHVSVRAMPMAGASLPPRGPPLLLPDLLLRSLSIACPHAMHA